MKTPETLFGLDMLGVTAIIEHAQAEEAAVLFLWHSSSLMHVEHNERERDLKLWASANKYADWKQFS